MKKIFFSTLLIIASFLVSPYKQYAADSGAEELKLLVGQVKILSVDNPKRIVIGNSAIADVTNVTKKEVTLSPKSAGTTTLVIWDNFGEMSYKVKVFTEDLQELKLRIDNLLKQLNVPGVYTKVDEVEGRVFLLGSIKCPSDSSTKPPSDSSTKPPSDSSTESCPDRERINAMLAPLKDKITDLIQTREDEAVVEIDVQVLELDKDATNVLGFSWPGALSFTEVGSAGISTAGAKFGKLFKILNWQRTAFNWSIDALIQEGKARILSRPRLACQSGKEAELLVGGERPILTTEIVGTGGGTAGTATVSYKDYGIKLKIKPIVREDGRIKLVLNTEVSEIGEVIVLGTVENPTAKAWPLSKRNVSTELILDDQQTLAIGGLIKRKAEEDVRRVPFLSDLPVVGALFRRKLTKIGNGQGERGDTELFITLTPTIVSGKEEATVSQQKINTEAAEAISSRYDIPQELEGYAHVIQKRILQNLSYPSAAKDAGFQGTVTLGLHLSYKGDLLDVSVKDSSGFKIIDDDAITVVKGIASYPPFPTSITSKDLWIDIPIEYRLN